MKSIIQLFRLVYLFALFPRDVQEKRIVVGSEHGVLALLQQHSGAALWRHVLPRGERRRPHAAPLCP